MKLILLSPIFCFGKNGGAGGGEYSCEGERVLALLKQNASPFCYGWENWTAPEEWGLPDLPPGWDQL
jgi:hypothetical protein